MKLWLLLVPLLAAGQERFEAFQRDLQQIRSDLLVPGMAAAIVESGRVVWRADFGVTRAVQMPIASITKTMTAVLAMQLVEQKKLTVDERLRRVLSHTSDGTPGEEFLYNGALFNAMTTEVEKASGMKLTQLLRRRIFAPLGMNHTIAPRGVSAASGVISTTSDLARYAIALDGVRLVQPKSKEAMFTPARSNHGAILPYGLGWFSQVYNGERIVWHYGQEVKYGTLFLKIPNRKLTLIVLANSNAISDASRLLDGNVARSPLAMAFFKDVVFAGSAAPELVRDEMVDRSLVALYRERREESAAILRAALEKFPELESSGELSLLGLFARLGFAQTESCATVLLKDHPNLPPAWFYYGIYLQNAGRNREAAAAFEQITGRQPPWHHWSVGLARQQLKSLQ